VLLRREEQELVSCFERFDLDESGYGTAPVLLRRDDSFCVVIGDAVLIEALTFHRSKNRTRHDQYHCILEQDQIHADSISNQYHNQHPNLQYCSGFTKKKRPVLCQWDEL
jgi:hypothetical protein